MDIESANTQTTEAERAALVQFASGKKRLVEIGVFEGFTTAILLRTIGPDAQLYAIDPFLPGRLGICWGKWIAQREVKKVRPGNRVRFVEMLSHRASRAIEGDFDFVFIDADHSLEGIKQDWRDWSPRVSACGAIALHDTRLPSHNPNVATFGSYQYFEEHIRFDKRFEVVEQVDSLSILIRKADK